MTALSEKGEHAGLSGVPVVTMFEALRPCRDDSVLDLRRAAVHALDRLRGEGDRFLDVQVRTISLDDRLERLVRGLADGERRAFERRAARAHLDQLHPEV